MPIKEHRPFDGPVHTNAALGVMLIPSFPFSNHSICDLIGSGCYVIINILTLILSV